MIRPVKDFTDQWGLLDKLVSRDGGDTCQREGMYWSLLGIMNIKDRSKYSRYVFKYNYLDEYHKVWKRLHPADGILLRHSFSAYDASDWDRMSRDQFQCKVISDGYWSPTRELKRLKRGHWKRWFIRTNNIRNNGATKHNHGKVKNEKGELYDYSPQSADFTGPEIWANFIRAEKNPLKYILLLLFDIELLGGAIKWRWFRKHNIAMNQATSQLQAMDRYPTPLSFLANIIMPIDKYIPLIEEHFTDFHPTDDMLFFGDMFRDALKEVKNKNIIDKFR